eukprot:6782440-Pyramimonas_sp.AAC.1
MSASGIKSSRSAVPVSTPILRPTPACRPISMSCHESPTIATSPGSMPTASQNACTMPGFGFAPNPES